MIHLNLDNFDLNKLNSFDAILTIGNYNTRQSFKFDNFNFVKENNKILVRLNSLSNEILNLYNSYERLTLSFISKDEKSFNQIYDNDSFVSYVYPAHYVMKLKKINKEGYDLEITSSLVDENED